MDCFCHKQCQICHEFNRVQCSKLRKCPNEGCNAFVCNHCMNIWLQENTSCPICHNTEIDPLKEEHNCYNRVSPEPPEDIENQSIQQVITNKPINCICACNCHCKYNDLPLLIKIIIVVISLWLLGFISYLGTIYLVTYNYEDFYDNYKEYLGNPVFNMFIIIWGFFTLLIIGGLSICCSCTRRLCFME